MDPPHRFDPGESLLLGSAFRAELRSALYLRRVSGRPLAADDVEDLRADAFARYAERAAEVCDALDSQALARRVISLAVYHRFCRDGRRARTAGTAMLRLVDAEAPSRGEPDDPARPAPAYVARKRLRALAIPDPLLGRARGAVGAVLASIADGALRGRGGSRRAGKPVSVGGRILRGSMRWIREFEGDPRLAALARELVRDRDGAASELLATLRRAAEWRSSRLSAVAQLAGAAVSEWTGTESQARRAG
ncbi:MAG TPA: hypothetical protein VKE69_03720 [Planctomycetota bacterium]|nr:hypothetical protein [Planctomycetota bacterium]